MFWLPKRFAPEPSPATAAPESPPDAPEKKGVLGTSTSLGSFLQFGVAGAETPGQAIRLYEQSTAVSIPVNKIAEPFSYIVPLLEINGRVVDDHPILELLAAPSPFFDRVLFLQALAKWYLVCDEVELVALGTQSRPPLEIQPISPANVSVVEGEHGLASVLDITGSTLTGSYKLELKQNRARYFNGQLRECYQIRGFSPRNNSLLRGQSKLVAAAAEARQHILGNKHNTSLLENGGRLSYMFHYEEDMDADDFEAVKQRVREQYGGAPNAGKIGVSAGGKMDVKELGVNNKDMDYVKALQMAINSVALQYNVPLPLVSNDRQTFNNYGNAIIALFDDAVLPLFGRIYSALGQFLFPRYKLDPRKTRFVFDPLSIPALRQRILTEIKTRKDINIESDNELRTDLGLEPYKGGDVILKPATLVPAGTDLFTDTGAPIPEPEASLMQLDAGPDDGGE